MSDQLPEPPHGAQYRLELDDQWVVVTEVGATLREFRVGSRPVVDGFAEADICPGGHGQQLIPWPNRIGEGRYHFGGEEHQLPLTEPSRGNAIHGLVRWANWIADQPTATRLTMGLRLHAQPGYPFSLDLAIDYTLGGGGLTVTTTARNIGANPAPYGAGAHPYLTAGTATIDPCRLRLPAATRILADDRLLPAGRAPVDGSEFDFRELRLIGDTRLDTAFTTLLRDDDRRARVFLESPVEERVVLWVDEHYPWLMVYTGDTLDEVHRRRRGIGIEPMSCPPDAFRTGEDLLVLEPGASTAATWGIDTTGFRR